MKVQILGGRGMLGRAISLAATISSCEVIATELDICHVMPADITAPVVINCAGIVKGRNVPADEYRAVNGLGPYRLAQACSTVGARMVHVSTDCVFSKPGPHDEDDEPDATDIYAFSKQLGEVTFAPHLTIRTSFVGFGQRGLIAELQRSTSITASRNLLWTGHMVATVAGVLLMLVERPDITGLLHVPGTEQSRYDLVACLVRALGLKVHIIEDDSFVADRRLCSNRWHALGLPELPPFPQQLHQKRGIHASTRAN